MLRHNPYPARACAHEGVSCLNALQVYRRAVDAAWAALTAGNNNTAGNISTDTTSARANNMPGSSSSSSSSSSSDSSSRSSLQSQNLQLAAAKSSVALSQQEQWDLEQVCVYVCVSVHVQVCEWDAVSPLREMSADWVLCQKYLKRTSGILGHSPSTNCAKALKEHMCFVQLTDAEHLSRHKGSELIIDSKFIYQSCVAVILWMRKCTHTHSVLSWHTHTR